MFSNTLTFPSAQSRAAFSSWSAHLCALMGSSKYSATGVDQDTASIWMRLSDAWATQMLRPLKEAGSVYSIKKSVRPNPPAELSAKVAASSRCWASCSATGGPKSELLSTAADTAAVAGKRQSDAHRGGMPGQGQNLFAYLICLKLLAQHRLHLQLLPVFQSWEREEHRNHGESHIATFVLYLAA